MSNNQEKSGDIKSTLYESQVLWFNPYSQAESETGEENESDEIRIGINPYFDYEIPAPNQWLVHIDLEIDYPALATIRVRTSYEVNCIFENLLTHECLDLLHEKALEMTINGFNNYCEKSDKEFLPLETDMYSQFIPEFSEQIIKNIMLRRKEDFTFLSHDINVFTIIKTDLMRFIITATFVIMEDILYNNPAFDLKHNRKVFHAIIPSQVYFTTKFICLTIAEGDIKLVMNHNIVFQICIDCALQIILDEHLETLLPSITKHGFTRDMRSQFLKFGTKFLNDCRKELKDKEIEIANLQTRYDWNKLIR